MDTSSPTTSSSHILHQLLGLKLFKRASLDEYDTYLFNSSHDLKLLLLDIIDMINEFLDIDENGNALSNYERRMITTCATELKEIQSDIDHSMNRITLDTTQKLVEDRYLEISRSLHDQLQQFHTLLRGAINCVLLHRIAPDYSKLSEYRIDIEKDKNSAKKLVQEVEKSAGEAKKLVAEIALLPTKQQVTSFSKMFGDESRSFKDASILWIVGVFACLGGVVGASIYYSKLVTDAEFSKFTVNQIIQFNLTKVLTISALFYGLAICNKNYKSSKHNQILNKHRENALASFQAFVQVPTADNETKNAVLLEATRTIFGAQQTGYVVTENDDSPNKIIEIIKTIQEKS